MGRCMRAAMGDLMRRSAFCFDDEDRTGSVADNFFGNTSQDGALYPATAMTANHDKVRWPAFGGVDNGRGRPPYLNKFQSGRFFW